MTCIYLIRHGQASFAADNYDQLSDLGIKQAGILGTFLQQKNITPDVTIIGGMKRHRQTAEHSLETMRLPLNVIEDSRWNEYDHQNILAQYNRAFATPKGIRSFLASEKEPSEVFQKHFVAAMEQWTNTCNSEQYNESWTQFTTRLIAAFNDLIENHQGKTILVYSSGGAISIIASLLLGLPLEQFIRINGTLVNAGITKAVARGKDKDILLSTLNEHHMFEQQGDKKLITYT